MAKKKIVVKQSTIDQIKKLGMTAALKKAGKSSNAEYLEGVKRMYGAKRLNAAVKSAPVAKSPDAARPKQQLGPKKTVAPSAPKYTSKNPKPMNPKGLFPGLLTGNYKSKSKPTPQPKPTKSQMAIGKARAGGR